MLEWLLIIGMWVGIFATLMGMEVPWISALSFANIGTAFLVAILTLRYR